MSFDLRRLGWLALVLLCAATGSAQGVDVVYVSNPAEGAIYAIDPAAGPAQVPTLVFAERRFDVGDMVVGPDDLLYVCAPDEGRLFRLDPAPVLSGGAPYSLAGVDIIPTPGVNAPQCGWFSDKGDLFLTDRSSPTAVWIYEDLVPLSPDTPPPSLEPLVAASGAFFRFEGQGVTQAAKGDLLFVDQRNGAVGSLPFDSIFRFDAPFSPGATVEFSGLSDPVGIARLGNGTVFIASGRNVISYGGYACPDLGFGNQTPEFLELSADDVLYVASAAKREATLWAVDAASCGDPVALFTFAKPDYTPGLSGVAIPKSSRTTAVPGIGFEPDYLFNFKDHAYELSFSPTGICTPNPIVANEIDPACLVNVINGGYIIDDNNDPDTSVTGVPVTYAGDGGVAQLYTVTGACQPVEKTIQHAISAYTALVGNPRIVRCVFPEGTDYCNPPAQPCPPGGGCGEPAYCELIELESFFPFNGVFPEDGRISGIRSATTSDFSEYFIADVDLADGSFDSTPGCFCGWESPLSNQDRLDPNDPFFGLPTFNGGSAVPLKFRVAALPPGGSCEPGDPAYVDVCSGAPYGYVTGAQVLLSVAKIYDAFGVEDFTPLVPTATASSTPGNIFGDPSSPSTPYHYNLDTSGYEPGVYQAVAVALTDNFRVDWTYFVID
ncbi:MAG TPA: hypothetical protein VLB51_00895 [Methylomirabilota bacterium]|nr:hypothetical protein [Methylomirabilota bacterium]